MPIPLPLLIPLCSGFVYAMAALCLKRATGAGIGPWRVGFACNLIQALVFAPQWLLGGQPFTWEHLTHAILCGFAFFTGQTFTFLALSRGDVSVATPVLGTKVLFVALMAVALGSEPLTTGMWMAALLTTLATAVLGFSGGKRHHSLAASLLFGFAAAASFALTDVLSQKWAPSWGYGHFAPVMFGTVAVLSIGLIPFFQGRLAEVPWRWLIPGAGFLSLQAAGIAYSIIAFKSATTTNVIYNSRGVWSVVLVWAIGPWFSNRERDLGARVMVQRLIGASLLLAAIGLIMR